MRTLSIAGIAIRELISERVFLLVLSFFILCLILSIFAGNLTYSGQYQLRLNLILAVSEISQILFSTFMGITLFKKELTLGSIAMVLSKPISRTTFVIGKYLGQITVQFLLCLLMAVILMGFVFSYEHFSAISILLAYWLIFLETVVITSVAYLFAINSGAITASVATLLFAVLGHLHSPLDQNISSSSFEGWIWKLIKSLTSNLEIFNAKSLASYGLYYAPIELGWATLYACLCVAFYLSVTCFTFHHKDVLT